MTETRLPIEVRDSTGRKIEAELLTGKQREARRRSRRRERSEREQGLRILRASIRHVTRGNNARAKQTFVQGFARLLLDAAKRRLK